MKKSSSQMIKEAVGKYDKINPESHKRLSMIGNLAEELSLENEGRLIGVTYDIISNSAKVSMSTDYLFFEKGADNHFFKLIHNADSVSFFSIDDDTFGVDFVIKDVLTSE